MTLIGELLMVFGALFLALGALGLVRMPDVFNRIQAGTKAATLGAVAFLTGVAFCHPDWWAKLALIGFFILVTSPIGSSTIARAAFLSGQVPWKPKSDEQEST